MRQCYVALAIAGLLLPLSVMPVYAGKAHAYKGWYAHKALGSLGYIGLDGASLTLDSAAVDNDDTHPMGLRLRLGIPVDQNLDVELHLGRGTDRDVASFDEMRVTYLGAYLKGYLPVGQRSALYVLGGYSALEIEQTLDALTLSDDRLGWSYGIGLETQLSETLDLSADYTRYAVGDSRFPDLTAVSLGIKFYF